MDYHHYAYKCPYITGTKDKTVYCTGGSRVACPSIGACRRYLQAFCASEDGWQDCTVAQMITECENTKEKLKGGIKTWQGKKDRN